MTTGRAMLMGFVLFVLTAAAGAQGAVFAEQMIDKLNAGDVEAYGAWRRGALAKLEPGDAWRASFESLRETLGAVEVVDVVEDGDEATLVLATASGDEVAMIFTFEPSGERRIVGIIMAREDGGPDIGGFLDEVGRPPVNGSMSRAQLGSALDEWLTGLTAADAFAGVVRIERHGELMYEGAFGFADRGFEVPHTAGTSIRIGSITKTMMQVIVAKLFEEGVLDPDATVADVISNSGVDRADEMTLRHLLEHRSGLADFDFGAFLEHPNRLVRRPRDYLPFIVDRPLAFDPGTDERYSNAGYILLGVIVEEATGERYEDVMQRLVFDPAGMTSSGFYPLDRVHPGVATGYWRCEGRAGPWCTNNIYIEVEGSPSGGSYSSAADLSRFSEALRSGALLDDARWTHWVFTNEWPSERQPNPTLWRAGWAGGGEGVSAVIVDRSGWLIIALANLEEPSGEAVGLALLEALRGG